MGFCCSKRPLYLLQADVAGSLGLRGLAWFAHDQLLVRHDSQGIILPRRLIGLLAENGQSKLKWFQKKILDARIVLLFSFSE